MKIIKISREAIPKIGRIFSEDLRFRAMTERMRSIKLECEVRKWKDRTIFLPSFFELDFTENEIDYVKNELSKPEYSRHNWAQLILIQI